MSDQWWSLLPFGVMLACIATAPLTGVTSDLWGRTSVQLAVSLILGTPVAILLIADGEAGSVASALVEYLQFIMLLLALFVVSGGIHLAGDLRATPITNTVFLAVGGLLASFVGTTGAAMLLIRPLLNTNAERRFRAHTVTFCIFVVANCGGLLTPLGDPPLFLGMLRGVPFTWTFHLVPEWLIVNTLLLITYWALDRRVSAREPAALRALDDTSVTPLRLIGTTQLPYIAIIVAAVAFTPSVDSHDLGAGTIIPWREVILLAVTVLSLYTGGKEARYILNRFRWRPIVEVATLFLGIFLTMIPALRFLERIAPHLPLNDVTFFLFTGGLSSVLDNAPTYLTFFGMARELGGEPAVAGVFEPYLVAISTGAVFCGAMTYIGNGPNFMIKAVAEDEGVEMPSFGAYIVASFRYLAPVLAVMVLIFIAPGQVATIVGIATIAVILGRAAWLDTRAQRWRLRSEDRE